MKYLSLIVLVSVVLLVACNNTNKKKAEKTDNKIENIEVEEVEVDEIDKDENTEDSYYYGFKILSKELDFLVIGEPLTDEIPDFISYKNYEELTYEEGTEVLNKYFAITDNQKEIIIANLRDDIVVRIDILSQIAKTEEGVCVGSLLEDMAGNFPDIKIFYTYVGDFFFAETQEYQDVQFILPTDAYKLDRSKLSYSDLVEVFPQDFDETAEIIMIKMY